jgi:hypothetical protein
MIGVIAQTGIVVALIIIAGLCVSMIIQSKMISMHMKALPQQIELERRMDYTTRVYQQSNYAADLKSTRSADLIIAKYKKGAQQFIAYVRRLQIKVSFYDLGIAFVSKIADYIIIIYIGYGLITGRVESVGAYATLIAAATVLSKSLDSAARYV